MVSELCFEPVRWSLVSYTNIVLDAPRPGSRSAWSSGVVNVLHPVVNIVACLFLG